MSKNTCLPFKAREELLDYKKLLDEGVLTQEELNGKAKALKNKIL